MVSAPAVTVAPRENAGDSRERPGYDRIIIRIMGDSDGGGSD